MTFNFSIIVNNCLAELDLDSESPEFYYNDFLLSLINGFEDGKWRENQFNNFILDNVAETGLSAEERRNLYSAPYTLLTEAIKNLRLCDKDKGRGSEIAEIILYGIMREHYGALPVVPKIFYKQNSNDNAKGADSVHIVLNEKDGDFTLWLGEAKFYKSIEDESLLNQVLKSVFEIIRSEKIKKEDSIITNVKDLELLVSGNMLEEIRQVLHRDSSIDEIRKRLNIPILLLHECNITKEANALTDSFKEKIKNFHLEKAKKYFSLQNKKQKKIQLFGYENIHFHLILFPVPDKEKIVNRFITRAKQIKEDA